MEKLVATQIHKYLSKFRLLYEHQYGFRKLHNTNHPTLHFLDKVYKSLNKDQPEYTLGVFLDTKKAFGTVDNDISLKKLHNYAFQDLVNIWFNNYLKARIQ